MRFPDVDTRHDQIRRFLTERYRASVQLSHKPRTQVRPRSRSGLHRRGSRLFWDRTPLVSSSEALEVRSSGSAISARRLVRSKWVTVEILNRVAAFPKQLASTSRLGCIRIASLASRRIHTTERRFAAAALQLRACPINLLHRFAIRHGEEHARVGRGVPPCRPLSFAGLSSSFFRLLDPPA